MLKATLVGLVLVAAGVAAFTLTGEETPAAGVSCIAASLAPESVLAERLAPPYSAGPLAVHEESALDLAPNAMGEVLVEVTNSSTPWDPDAGIHFTAMLASTQRGAYSVDVFLVDAAGATRIVPTMDRELHSQSSGFMYDLFRKINYTGDVAVPTDALLQVTNHTGCPASVYVEAAVYRP